MNSRPTSDKHSTENDAAMDVITNEESNSITTTSSQNQAEDTQHETDEPPAVDEEGLYKNGYDVILYGTGLTQSILASALTRAGKSVLHCDGNDFYGEKDAVFSLGSLMEWTKVKKSSDSKKREITKDKEQKEDHENFISLHSEGTLSSIQIHSQTDFGASSNQLAQGMDVVTPYGVGCIESLPSCDDNSSENVCKYKSLAIQLKNWTLANGTSPIAYFGYHKSESKSPTNGDEKEYISTYYAKTHDIIPLAMFQFQKYIVSRQRSFALDLTPGLLYANGEEVKGLVDSGVSEYCEFKSLLGLYLFMKKESPKTKRRVSTNSSTSSTSSTDESLFQLSRVPCSKRDVFQTKLLSPVEKRKLMKFLQIATDYAFAKSSVPSNDGENTKNESNSKNGDSETTQTAVEEEVLTSLNERQLSQGRSLYRPQNKTVSTTDLERLRQCFDEGMDFISYLEKEHKLTPRLRDIVIYAMSLASNTEGKDSSYSTEDGMNDLSRHLQSLGKYGGTAFLVPLYGAGELSQAFCRSAAVHGGTYLLRRSLRKILLDEDSGRVSGVELGPSSVDDGPAIPPKEIPSKYVIVPQESIQSSSTTQTSPQRILRRISILRGKLLLDDNGSNSEQRHIIIIPPNTVGNQNVIHGIVLDETANIAPPYYGEDFTTTVLHLTTIVDGTNLSNENLLRKTIESLIEKSRNAAGVKDLEEIYHLNFSSNLMHSQQLQKPGLYVCNQSGPSVTLQSAFLEASAIFTSICPDCNFLTLSQAMDERVKESKFGLTDEDNDVDKAVLESAMDIVSSTVVSDQN